LAAGKLDRMSGSFTSIAKQLGRRGGVQRARRLPPQRRAEIARLGALARLESLRLARAIRTNFDYVAAVRQLAPPTPVESTSAHVGRLPRIHG